VTVVWWKWSSGVCPSGWTNMSNMSDQRDQSKYKITPNKSKKYQHRENNDVQAIACATTASERRVCGGGGGGGGAPAGAHNVRGTRQHRHCLRNGSQRAKRRAIATSHCEASCTFCVVKKNKSKACLKSDRFVLDSLCCEIPRVDHVLFHLWTHLAHLSVVRPRKYRVCGVGVR
jgi:hypothetical protein